MAKRRPSIQGRGAEILFGEPPAVEIEPKDAEDFDTDFVPAATGSDVDGDLLPTVPERDLDEEALEQALLEEALAGAPGETQDEGESTPPEPELAKDSETPPKEESEFGEEEEFSSIEDELPPTPEMDLEFAEALVVDVPQPITEASAPSLEDTMEERDLRDDPAIYEPPPPQGDDTPRGVLPPRRDPVSMELSMESLEPSITYDIQDSGDPVEPFELPERSLSKEEQQELLARIGLERIQELDEEISKAYDQVLSKIGENNDLTVESFNYLLKARDIVLRREAVRLPQAEYYVHQVRARLKRASESESGAKKYAWWIAGWGLFWFFGYLAILILLNYDWFQALLTPGMVSNSPLNMDIFLPAMVWGGIGGVAAVFYSLFKHVGRRDFDSQYNLSYVGKPFLGVILGATVYMVIHLLIMTLGILPAGIQVGSESANMPVVTPWIIYLMAWACGFKENRILDLVDRVMKRVFSGDKEDDPEPIPDLSS